MYKKNFDLIIFIDYAFLSLKVFNNTIYLKLKEDEKNVLIYFYILGVGHNKNLVLWYDAYVPDKINSSNLIGNFLITLRL